MTPVPNGPPVEIEAADDGELLLIGDLDPRPLIMTLHPPCSVPLIASTWKQTDELRPSPRRFVPSSVRNTTVSRSTAKLTG